MHDTGRTSNTALHPSPSCGLRPLPPEQRSCEPGSRPRRQTLAPGMSTHTHMFASSLFQTATGMIVISCCRLRTQHEHTPLPHLSGLSLSLFRSSFWLARWIPAVCVCKQARGGAVKARCGMARVNEVGRKREREGEREGLLTISRALSCCL